MDLNYAVKPGEEQIILKCSCKFVIFRKRNNNSISCHFLFLGSGALPVLPPVAPVFGQGSVPIYTTNVSHLT